MPCSTAGSQSQGFSRRAACIVISFVAYRRIYFETDLFKGCSVIHADNLPSTPPGLFKGQKRKTSITIQGQFKRPLPLDDVVTGQEFQRQPKNLPAMWLVETVLIKVCTGLPKLKVASELLLIFRTLLQSGRHERLWVGKRTSPHSAYERLISPA